MGSDSGPSNVATPARFDSPKRARTGGDQDKGATRRARATLTDADKDKYHQGNQQELLVTLLKSSPNLHQRVRTVEHAVMDTYILQSKDELITVLAETMSAYQQKVRAAGAKHEMGSPTPYMLNSLVEFLSRPATDIGQANRSAMSALKSLLENMPAPHNALEHCKHLTTKQCFNKANTKLCVICPNRETRATIHDSLLQLGVEWKAEKQPASSLEDDMEKWIQALESTK